MADSFGQLIKQQRIEMSMTQLRLAELVGRSASTIRSWERDRAVPVETDVVVALAAVLGVDVVHLGQLVGLDIAEPVRPTPSGTARSEESGRIHPSPDPSPTTQDARVEENGELLIDDRSSIGGESRIDPANDAAQDFSSAEVFDAPIEPHELDRQPEIPDGTLDDVDDHALMFEDDPRDEIGSAGILGETPVDQSSLDQPALDQPALDQASEQIPISSVGPNDTHMPDTEGDDGVGEPTQVVMVDKAGERLLGIATAEDIEFLAAPLKPTQPQPAEADLADPEATAVISVDDASEPTREVAREVRPAETAPRVASFRQQVLVQDRPAGPDSYLDDPREIRSYRIRAGLTAAALVIMLLVARWAWRGFGEQVGNILDTLTTGF